MKARFILGLLLLTFVAAGPLAGQQAPPAGAAPPTPEELDKLLAPIALYPDALVAQILTCAGSPYQVTALGDWLGKNSNLKGSELQAAAQKEGFDPSFVALSVFTQVVTMMASDIDWTRKVGQATNADRQSVLDSIQRLRTQAQAVGNLKTTEQQEVETVTADSGQQVIVIQPANPQVVYVPQYNPQTVYVTPPPPASSSGDAVAAGVIGFTAGVIIGAAASDHYYYGPYAWHGGAALYNDRWDDYYDHREDMFDDRSDNREDMIDNRQDMGGNRQENASQRQGSRDPNVDQRATPRSQNEASRQSSLSRGQASTQAAGRSSAFSGYGSASGARAASSRGHASRSRSGRRR